MDSTPFFSLLAQPFPDDRATGRSGSGWWIAVVLAWALLATPPAAAEPTFESVPRFDRLSVEDGLSHSTVWTALQDTDGFMWFGTEAGLNRFDGYDFKTYKHDRLAPSTLSASGVMALVQDRRGRLWVGTYGGGVDLFEPTSETFRHIPQAPGQDGDSLSDSIVFAMLEDAAGDLWIGTRSGLHRIDAERLEAERIPIVLDDGVEDGSDEDGSDEDGDEAPRILAVYQDRSGRLWAGTDCGLVSFDGSGSTSPCWRTPTSARGLAVTSVYDVVEDSRGRLWVGTAEGLRYLDEERGELLTPELGAPWIENQVQSLFIDGNGSLWIGYSTAGLTRFDPLDGRKATFTNDPSDPRSLSDDSVIRSLEDSTGILWFTTFLGINRLDPIQRQFPTYRHQVNHPNTLSSNSIWALEEDHRGHLWVGTYNEGLNRIDRQSGTVTLYEPRPGDDDSLAGGAINALHEDAQQTMWIGTWSGLSRWHDDDGRFHTLKHRPDDPTSLSHNIVQVIHEDRSRRLWVGTHQGLNRLDRATGRFQRLGHDGGVPASTSVNSVVEDIDGGLWFGSAASGLFYLPRDAAPEAPTFTRIRHREGTDGLVSDKIASLFLDADGVLWIGTYGAGLNRYDPEDGSFVHYGERQGLPSDTILGILPDDDGFLWLSTYSGLGRFAPTTGHCQIFSQVHGLQGDTFSDASHERTRDGELLFGGTAGLNIFDPRSITVRSDPPVVRLTDFQLLAGHDDSAEATLRRQFLDGQVVLRHHQDLFAIDFAALHFAAPGSHRYEYRLAGFDDAWIHTDARKRFAQYSNLDAGDYRFQVRARTLDGVESAAPATLRLTVLPPPWKTWWAYSLYSIIALSTLAAIGALQRRKFERERSISRRLRTVDRLKSEFLANTSHELRTPLYGMTGIAESLLEGAAGRLNENVRANLSMIVASGRRLTSLVDDLLDFSKIGKGRLDLHKQPVDLASMVEAVITLSRPLVGGKQVTLHNRVPVALPPALGDHNRLLQILHNLVGNAIKFTPEGQVIVSAEMVDDRLVVKVTDSGIGIDEDQWERIFEPFVQIDAAVDRQHGGAGLGLSVARELIHLHGGEIWVERHRPQGMVFLFSLPIATPGAQEIHVESLPKILSGSHQVETPKTSQVQPDMNPKPVVGRHLAAERDFHILIVDDEPINRQILVNMLSVQGYRLSETASGEEALQRLQEDSFDLVLLDVMMPIMSGYEACRTLRQSYSLQELPVIFLTAKTQESDLVSGFAAGGNDYLTKPVQRLELIARVRSHLERVYLHRHLESLVESRTQRISELNQELESRNDELERFTSTVTHDLKSPLVTIKGFLDFARQDALSGDVERIHKDFDRMTLATDKMHQLLESLLDVSRRKVARRSDRDTETSVDGPPAETARPEETPLPARSK